MASGADVAVIYGIGYWLGVALVIGLIVATVYAVAFLAHRARIAGKAYEARARAGTAREDVKRGNDLVLEYAALRRETEREMAQGRERLGGMKDAFDKGLKG